MKLTPFARVWTDKAVCGVGYVEDHQNPHEFLHRDDLGAGKFGTVKLAI